MRQDLQDRGALVQDTKYRDRAEKFIREESLDFFKSLHKARSFKPDYSSFKEPIIVIPGLVLGMYKNVWKDLESYRVHNGFSELKVYIGTWDIPENIEVLEKVKAAQTYSNIRLKVKTWSYFGDEFQSYIHHLYDHFGVEPEGYDIPPMFFKRYVTPFIYHATFNWVSDFEDSNPFVVKSRAACSFFKKDVPVWKDMLEYANWMTPFNSTLNQTVNSRGYTDYFVSEFCTNETANDIIFGASMNAIMRIFKYDLLEFADELFDIQYSSFKDHIKRLPRTLKELNDFCSTYNYIFTFDGPAWLGPMITRSNVPFCMDTAGWLNVRDRVYRVGVPYYSIENGQLVRSTDEMIKPIQGVGKDIELFTVDSLI